MFVGSELIEIFLPGVRSLKEKRKYLNSIKDKLKRNLNLSVSEVGCQDLLQHSELGLCTVCQDKKSIENILQKAGLVLARYPQLDIIIRGVEIEKKQKDR
ncbi:MAG: DUF503 domain-containing protein [Elusimicrobiota bacterium]